MCSGALEMVLAFGSVFFIKCFRSPTVGRLIVSRGGPQSDVHAVFLCPQGVCLTLSHEVHLGVVSLFPAV